MYFPKIQVKRPQQLRGLQPGQWIDYEGALGRYMGRIGGVVWIAWGDTARRRFKAFAAAFRAQRDRPPFQSRGRTHLTNVVNRAIANGSPVIAGRDIADGGIHRIV